MYYSEDDWQTVGAQSDGTFVAPTSVTQTSSPWDTPGGVPGDYSGVIDILKTGIGAWSAYKGRQQMIDYQRYEATNGGLFPTGYPNQQATANGRVAIQGNTNMMMILLVVGAFLLLRK